MLIISEIKSWNNNQPFSFVCSELSLREMCSNTEFFLVRVFLSSDWYRKIRTRKDSVFGHFSRRVQVSVFLWSWENLFWEKANIMLPTRKLRHAQKNKKNGKHSFFSYPESFSLILHFILRLRAFTIIFSNFY